MMKHAKGTFAMNSWDEKTREGKGWNEQSGMKLTLAKVSNAFKRDIEGEGTLEYLMFYRNDKSASFIGLEQVVGKLNGRSGSFVLQHVGVFEDGAAKATWTVVPGSGTGDLSGLKGEGGYTAGHEPPTPFTLDYDFE